MTGSDHVRIGDLFVFNYDCRLEGMRVYYLIVGFFQDEEGGEFIDALRLQQSSKGSDWIMQRLSDTHHNKTSLRSTSLWRSYGYELIARA